MIRTEEELRSALADFRTLYNMALHEERSDVMEEAVRSIGFLEWALREEKSLPAEARFSRIVTKMRAAWNTKAVREAEAREGGQKQQ
jgi:hypothetical protein